MFSCLAEPGVSVVIPVRDRRLLLRRALDSVLAQTRAADEIIVVDDGSCDGMSGELPHRYPTVRLLVTRGRGVSAARNHGIRASRHEWCALLDSDDAWRPRKLERQLECARATPAVRLWHCDERWWRNGAHLNQKACHRKRGGDVFADALARCVISPSAAMIHRTLWRDVGLFDERLPACEDYDLWLRVSARERVGFVPEVLVDKHGGHADQLSATTPALDRYRIRALRALLAHGTLTPRQAAHARDMLGHKVRIYAKGARRRGRDAEARELERMLEQEQQEAAAWAPSPA